MGIIGISAESLFTIGWGVLSIACLNLLEKQPVKNTHLRCSYCYQDHGEYICCECACQGVENEEERPPQPTFDSNFPLPIPDSIYKKTPATKKGGDDKAKYQKPGGTEKSKSASPKLKPIARDRGEADETTVADPHYENKHTRLSIERNSELEIKATHLGTAFEGSNQRLATNLDNRINVQNAPAGTDNEPRQTPRTDEMRKFTSPKMKPIAQDRKESDVISMAEPKFQNKSSRKSLEWNSKLEKETTALDTQGPNPKSVVNFDKGKKERNDPTVTNNESIKSATVVERRIPITSPIEQRQRSDSPHRMNPDTGAITQMGPEGRGKRHSRADSQGASSLCSTKIGCYSERPGKRNADLEEQKPKRRSSSQGVDFHPTNTNVGLKKLSTIPEIRQKSPESSQGKGGSERRTTLTSITTKSGNKNRGNRSSSLKPVQEDTQDDSILVCKRFITGEEEISYKTNNSTVIITECPYRTVKRTSVEPKLSVGSEKSSQNPNQKTTERGSLRSSRTATIVENQAVIEIRPNTRFHSTSLKTGSERTSNHKSSSISSSHGNRDQAKKQCNLDTQAQMPGKHSVTTSDPTSGLEQESEAPPTMEDPYLYPNQSLEKARALEAIRAASYVTAAPQSKHRCKRIRDDQEAKGKGDTERDSSVYRYSTEFREYRHLNRQKKRDSDRSSTTTTPTFTQ